MYATQTTIRVRYGETDQMGYAYYGAYALYYEVARVESLRQLGISYKSLESMGVIMPVYESHLRYIAPAFYDDMLTIHTFIKEMPSAARIRFDYEIKNDAGKKINEGYTVLVFVNKKTNRPCLPPTFFIELCKPYFP